MPKISNRRCSVCNKVSSMFIETNVGDQIKKRFFWDDTHHDMVCEDCKEIHEDLMLDYESKDDPWRNYSNDNIKEVLLLVEYDRFAAPSDEEFPEPLEEKA